MPKDENTRDPGTMSTKDLPGDSGHAGPATFSPGEVIAGRYRILLFIARGGMGEVYEAEDQDLRERVALKTIHPKIAVDDRAVERFKREIQLARKVTHPNVCRVFDLGHHESPSGSRVIFLTMELLRGETLAARLRRTPRLTPDEAGILVRQMVAALTAAHRVGVVHRDFKSGNIILASGRDSPDETRVVVTDFGLAHSAWLGDGFSATLTATGDLVGTPAYMAPEQLEGGEVTPAADIYALGVVMYEMLTGVLPFAGDTPLAGALRRLKEAPASPRTHCPELDPLWEDAILRCLQRNPADRFAAAADIERALLGEEVVLPRTRLQQRQRRRRWLIGAAAAAACVLTLATGQRLGLWRSLRAGAKESGAARPAPPPRVRPTLAVFGFKDSSASPESAWLATALSEAFAAQLAAGGTLRTVPPETVSGMRLDLSLDDADSLPKASLDRIRASTGADTVLLGSYFTIGRRGRGTLRLDIRLQDVATGAIRSYVSESGTEEALLDLVTRAGSRLRGALDLGELGAPDAASVRSALPAGLEASRSYAEGLERLRRFDALAARDLLEKAAAAEPKNPYVHDALGRAWAALGGVRKSREEARKALDLMTGLAEEGRLSIEGRYHEVMAEWDKAIEVYRQLRERVPDEVEYGLRLLRAQIAAEKGEEAHATLEALRALPPPLRADPRLDLAEARMAAAVHDLQRSREATGRAAERAKTDSARIRLAEARLLEAGALGFTDPDAAQTAYEEAARLYGELGDRRDSAMALLRLTFVLRERGDVAGAHKKYEEALALYRAVGDQGGTARVLTWLAFLIDCFEYNNPGQARSLYEEALGICRNTGDRDCEANVLDLLGNMMRRDGEQLDAARKNMEEALALYRELGNTHQIGSTTWNIGNILFAQGDLAGAKEHYEQAAAIWVSRGGKAEWSGLQFALRGIAAVRAEMGDLAGARKDYEQALAMITEGGMKAIALEASNDLSWLLILQGDLAGARKLADENLALARATGDRGVESSSCFTIVEIDRMAGNLKGAREMMAAAAAIEERATAQQPLPPEVSYARALIAQDEGGSAEAERLATDVAETFRRQRRPIDEALARGVVARARLEQGKLDGAREGAARATALLEKSLSLRARLAIAPTAARVLAASGIPSDVQEATRRLESVLADAAKSGFGALALEIRLALGQIEIASGQTDAGRSRLEKVEKEAAAEGFGVIARRAGLAREQRRPSPATPSVRPPSH